METAAAARGPLPARCEGALRWGVVLARPGMVRSRWVWRAGIRKRVSGPLPRCRCREGPVSVAWSPVSCVVWRCGARVVLDVFSGGRGCLAGVCVAFVGSSRAGIARVCQASAEK